MPLACLLTDGQDAQPGHDLYLARGDGLAGPGPTAWLPDELGHITVGDIISVAGDASRVGVLWKSTAAHNSLLLTEQCDNYCLMCSQPPKTRDDSWLFERAKQVVSLLPPAATGIGLTGGEPTLNEDAFIALLEHCRDVAPWLSLHLLTNGRRFADMRFAQRYAAVGLGDIMAGIPLYGPEPSLHDYVVQASGAFEETVHGILNLATLGQAIEVRIVVQLRTVPILVELAEFITRNLPFVSQVALMGLEMTGLARPNSAEVWIDPVDYQDQLREAASVLTDARIHTKIYNHQLCVLDERLWPLAVRSISDWKNDYLDECTRCAVRDLCGGVFTTSGNRLSPSLHPLALVPGQA
ncbi:MAG TPA: His-Xaa-Ser system radical SAM maturase HxsC [Streptosporangiaceae bacterium]|jgi:His-Xaa-Ser system radical SAM maturase HxsC